MAFVKFKEYFVFIIIYCVHICSCNVSNLEVTANGKMIWSGNIAMDNVVEYSFKEGDSVNFTCKDPEGLNGIHFESDATLGTDKSYILMFPQMVEEIFLYLKLSAADDNKQIICNRGPGYFNKTTTSIRIRLKLEKNTDPVFSDVVPIKTSCSSPYICYTYPYYPGEAVLLKTRKDWSCFDDGERQPGRVEINFTSDQTLSYGLKNINCETRLNSGVINLHFSPYPMENLDYTINGLSFANTLGFFTSDTKTLNILYKYTEALNLTCASKNSNLGLEWKSEPSAIEVENTNSEKNKVFSLKENITDGNISCVTNNKETNERIEVVLIREKEKKKTEEVTTVTPLSDLDDGNGNKIGVEVIIIAAVCTGIFIIAAISYAISRCIEKKPVSRNPETNINYENLPAHNQGTMPLPTQWQEAQYSAPADRITNNDYAVPFKPNIEDLYSKPIPKHQRTETDNSGYATIGPKPEKTHKGVPVLPVNDTMYAELDLKPAVPKKPNLQSTSTDYSENPYQEVTFSESPYADPQSFQSKGYVNVFNDPRYVNAENKSDYAEPAYCEIGKVNK